ncbi:nitroreductase family protein, partial [Streptosporangiaceae bacterium NEAU-GS5]|nr:nitroreductase family protein [Streptosporangiaceae bacterium NEAU-GS5]MBO3753210.1 nitroreductase family protein [Streptosporangiaceae bacterium NEAU-GS5]
MDTLSTNTLQAALHTALEAATWAPSVHNTQPWAFTIQGVEVELRMDTDRKL